MAHGSDRQPIELGFAVITFLNEKHLAAAAGHLGWFGIEPARARGITRAGFFELAGDFPGSFVFALICALQGNSTAEETHNQRTQPEKGCRFHSANFISARAIEQTDFEYPQGATASERAHRYDGWEG